MPNENQTKQDPEFPAGGEASNDLWERALEFDFARWITLSPLLALGKARREGKRIETDHYDKLIEDAYRERRYVPAGGKLEQLTGDGFLKSEATKFCVVECKGLVVGESWKREAQPPSEQNPGGKNRLSTLQKLGLGRLRALGDKCHYLVGYAKKKNDVVCVPYWKFINDGPDGLKPLIKKLDEMEGVSRLEFFAYLKALISAGGKSIGEAEVQFIAIDANGVRHAWKTTIEGLDLVFSASIQNEEIQILQDEIGPAEGGDEPRVTETHNTSTESRRVRHTG